MGIDDLFSFDFMDPPSQEALASAVEELRKLGALDENEAITNLGRKIAEFPLDPLLSKMLLTSVDFGCSDEILTVTAMIQAGNIFYRPRDKQEEADKKRAKFVQPSGDHLTHLSVYVAWEKAARNCFSAGQWCYDNFVQPQSMRRARDVRKQLLSIMERQNLNVVSCGKNHTKVQRAIAAGFFANAARKDPIGRGYIRVADNQSVYIHPSSTLFSSKRQPQWVIYIELVMTSKAYMRDVTAVDFNWLPKSVSSTIKSAGSRSKSVCTTDTTYL